MIFFIVIRPNYNILDVKWLTYTTQICFRCCWGPNAKSQVSKVYKTHPDFEFYNQLFIRSDKSTFKVQTASILLHSSLRWSTVSEGSWITAQLHCIKVAQAISFKEAINIPNHWYILYWNLYLCISLSLVYNQTHT